MATQIIPQSTETPPSASTESQSQQTPPTDQQPDGVTKPSEDKDALYVQLLRENNKKIQELENQLAEAKKPAPPPERSREELNQAFFNDPVSVIDDRMERLERRLRDSIAPLQEVANQFNRTSAIDNLIAQFKSDARFSSAWNQPLENWIREEAAKVDPKYLNENSFGIIVINGIGMQSIGMINKPPAPVPSTPSNNNLPPTPSNTMVTPPHMRPSAPPSNNPQDNQPKHRELTELEKRVARERGLSDEAYLELLDVPASQVVLSTAGKKGGNQ